MNREVKFRRYWSVINKMVHFDFADGELTYSSSKKIGMFVPAKEKELYVGKSILMQHTGLKDKNGKDIYEGDLHRNPDGSLSQVVWDEYNARFAWSPLCLDGEVERGSLGEMEMGVDSEDAEIIGNIYQNKELLKSKHKKMSNDKISVCPNCDNPLISTVAFAGAEWFCWECRWRGGIFYEKSVGRTTELVEKLKSDNMKFDEIRSDLWLGGERVSECKKCEDGKERHVHHLTHKEKERCQRARGMVGSKI